MQLPFRKIEIEDRQAIERCTGYYQYHLCEHCFVDLYMWQDNYQTQICFFEDFLLVKMKPTNNILDTFYLAPIGRGDLKRAIEAIQADAAARGIMFFMVSIAEPMLARIEQAFPGCFFFEHGTEDGDDYIYLAEKMRTLAGKKLQSKRNLVNRFRAEYEGRWTFETLEAEAVDKVLAFHAAWCKKRGMVEGQDFEGETRALQRVLRHLDSLPTKGGVLRLDGDIIGFTLGTQSTQDMYVIQIEKADSDIAGAYQMINQQFAQRFCQDVTYINREEDLGLEGLRKAKRSYYPVMRGVKYAAWVK